MKIVTHVYDEDGGVTGSEILEGDPAEVVALMVARNVMYEGAEANDEHIRDVVHEFLEMRDACEAECETCGNGPCVSEGRDQACAIDEFEDGKLDTPWTPANGRVLGPDVVPVSLVDFIDQHCGIGAIATRERIGEYEKSTMVIGPGELRIDGNLVGRVLGGAFTKYPSAEAKSEAYAEAYGAVKELPTDLLMNTVARSREQLLRSNHMKDEYGDLIDNSQALELLGRVAQVVLSEEERRTPQGWAQHFNFDVINATVDPNFYSGLATEEVFLRAMLPHYTVVPTGVVAMPGGMFHSFGWDRDGTQYLKNFQYYGPDYNRRAAKVEVMHG